MILFRSTFVVSALLLGVVQSAYPAYTVNDPTTLPQATVELVRNDPAATRLTVSTPELGRLEASNAEGRRVERTALEMEPVTARPGWPELPIVSRIVYVPPTGGIHLDIKEVSSYQETGFHPFIAPNQDGSEDVDLSGIPSDEYRAFNGFWPPNAIEVGEPAILRGHRLVPVKIYPIQVNPQTGEVRYNTHVDFELTYSGQGINEVVNPLRPRPSGTINRLIESLVVNPPLLTRDSPQRGTYLLCYINGNGVANALAPLINWRKRQGWTVQTMAFNAGTSTNDIKNQIQRAYNDWDLPPEMIALVGDPDNSGIPAWPNYTDLDYTKLDGNDILSDADYGRISCGNNQELDRVVAKIINYESDPYMDNTDWFRQGAVCAGAAVSGLSTILVNKWVRRETMDRGWENVHEWYFNAPFQGQSVPGFFQSEIQRGVNYVTYRGWIGMEGLSADAIMGFQATRRYPFATTMTCASGHYVGQFCQTEAFFRSAGGAIGSIGFATASTHVQYNNAFFTGIWHGLLKLEMFNLGTACNYGRYEVWRQYAGFEDNNVLNFSQWGNLMGDPATEMFTAIPDLVNCDYEQSAAVGSSRITVVVTDRNDDSGVAGAQVCLYKADDEFQTVIYTDENGVADFSIPPDALTEGNLLVTATKHNMKPHLGIIEVEEAELFIGTESWEVIEDGNGDGLVNPGEDITLQMVIKNFGSTDPDGAITLSFESLSAWARVDGEPVELEAAPQHGESVSLNTALLIDPSAPNGTAIPLGVYVRSGETVWRSMAAVQVLAPDVVISEAFIADNRLNPGEQQEIDFNLTNRGMTLIEDFTATLWSESEIVTIIDGDAAFPSINPDRSARIEGDRFRIRAHPLAIPGMKVVLTLAIETGSGFRDTTSYLLTVGSPQVTDPFGPDKYGYVCFDSGDRDWEMAPAYDWIEIDPQAQNNDYDGTVVNIQDGGEDNDRSAVMDLPFEFQYYGQVFDRVTICTNGWVAFGNWGELVDFRNRRINSGGGPNGQLCVLWDDLTTGRIITFYDEENGRFIVEWNGMRSAGDGSTQTFQLILFDTEVVPTYSGDGVIQFQYKEVRNPGGVGPANDTPYVTVGINSPTDLDGLEYTYYNTYHSGARQLGNELAIKFTTAIQFITGVLAVQVSDAATGAPIPGAEINTARGFWGECDQDGIAYLTDILIGDYEHLTVSARGYNDSTWFGEGENGEGFSIFEAETLWVAISLLHPEFNVNAEGFVFTMTPDSTTQTGFLLSNDGNGTLRFTSRFTYVIEDEAQAEPGDEESTGKGPPHRDDPDERWDPLLSWNASVAVDNNRLQGVTFVNDHWVVTGGHIANREDTLNYFYEFSRNGEYTGVRVPQETVGLYGYRDIEYSNGLIYCTYDPVSQIHAIDPTDYRVVSRWTLPRGFNNARNVTVDPETGHIWASGSTTRIYELEIQNDSVLVEVRNFRTVFPGTQSEIHEYGISWFRDDPDDFNIYLIAKEESGLDPNARSDAEHADVALFKMSPTTGEIRYLTDFGPLDGANQGRGGLSITPKWNNLVWGLAVMFDHPEGDPVTIFELAPNSSWVAYSPRTDTLFATESVPIELTIETADLDTGEYGVIIEFNHNAGEGTTSIPVSLHVVSSLPEVAIEDDPMTPYEYELSPAFPNPFNSAATIDYVLKAKGEVSLDLFDIQGRFIRSLVLGEQAAGRHRAVMDGSGLSTGLYFYRLNSGSFTATRKLVLTK